MSEPRTIVHDWYPAPAVEGEQHPGPFTADKLRKMIVQSPWGDKYCAPPEHALAQLATQFNRVDHLYKIKEVANTNQARAAAVHHALWVLMRFFDERRRACEVPGIDPRVVKRELGLCDQFDNFMGAMGNSSGTIDSVAPNDSPALTYMLPMDVGLGMWPYKNWHDFAHWIALAWQLAMDKGNRDRKFGPFGITNKGPIAWLTAETIGVIVGKTPSASTVGQHLKQPYCRKRPKTHPGRRRGRTFYR